MHLAQMREEEARQREETAERERSRAEPARPEVVRPERAPVPAARAPERVDPKVILESAGLQMVETNPAKARQLLPEPEPVHLGRPRRDRPASQPASEDLVQVETRK
jgi:hypothetical protein